MTTRPTDLEKMAEDSFHDGNYQKRLYVIGSYKKAYVAGFTVGYEAARKADAEVIRKLTEALEFVASNVTWVDEKNQSVSLTYAMGTVDVARKALSQHSAEVE